MKAITRVTNALKGYLAKIWRRMPVLIKAILLGFLVNIAGIYGVPIFGSILPLPWAFIAMAGFLLLYWKFFSGSWGHKSSAKARMKFFREGRLSPAVWKWSLAAAFSIVIVFQSSLVVTFRLIEFPAESFTASYGLDTLPLWAAWIAVVMSSLSAGLCEETGFRGYGQVPLEERYGPLVANLIISALFVAAHLHQVWSPPILLHIFGGSMMLGFLAYTSGSLLPGIIVHVILDIINFSYWWSDVAGKFDYATISTTGVDLHFLTWISIFALSVILFIWTVNKIKMTRLDQNKPHETMAQNPSKVDRLLLG